MNQKPKFCSVKGCDKLAIKFSKCRDHHREWNASSYKKWKGKQSPKSGRIQTKIPNKSNRIKRTQKSLKHNKEMYQGWPKILEDWDFICLECKLIYERAIEFTLPLGYMGSGDHTIYPYQYRAEDLQIAHIQSRGANISNAKDTQNQIPLCHRHHTQLDDKSKSEMLIFTLVQERILEMKQKQAKKDGRKF